MYFAKRFRIRTTSAFLVLIFMINASFAFSSGQTSQHQSIFTLELLITDFFDNPIEGAVVFINDQEAYEQVSNSHGIVIYHLSSGNYKLYSYAPDYIDYFNDINISDDLTYQVKHAEAVYWSTDPADAPIGVGEKNGIRLASAGEKLYLWAAYGGEPGTTNYGGLFDFFEYDTASDTWTQLPDAPFSSSYGISTSYGRNPGGEDAIYILKGYWTGQRTWFARYDINDDLWNDGLNHHIPWRTDLGNQYSGDGFQNYPRNGAAMAFCQDENYIYLFPGSGYGYEKYDWYRYSIDDDEWTDMGELPHKQGPGNAAVWVKGNSIGEDQNFIYVQFGLTPSGSYTNAEFWRYGITSGDWENLADHDYGADDGSMLVWDGEDYIFHSPGAYAEQTWDKGRSQKRELMQYSISTNIWLEMEKAPYNRWGGWDDAGGMVLINNTIYAMKGGDDVAWAENYFVSGGGDIPNNQLWKYKIDPKRYELEVIFSEGSGTIDLPIGEELYPDGTTVEFFATPNPGWEFEKWLVNGQLYCYKNPNFVIMDADKTLQAIFIEVPTHVFEPENIRPEIYTDRNTLILNLPAHNTSLRIYDIYGRELYKQSSLSSGKHRISFKFSPGVYIVNLVYKDTVFSQKIFLANTR